VWQNFKITIIASGAAPFQQKLRCSHNYRDKKSSCC